jgi:hypothetical protein
LNKNIQKGSGWRFVADGFRAGPPFPYLTGDATKPALGRTILFDMAIAICSLLSFLCGYTSRREIQRSGFGVSELLFHASLQMDVVVN